MKDECLRKQIITYMGNKRKLLDVIEYEVNNIKNSINNPINIFDGFSGSGIVSRLLKKHATSLYVNDIEPYSYTINKCYLSNKSDINFDELNSTIDYLNTRRFRKDNLGSISLNYTPNDDNNIKNGERAFFTRENGIIVDNMMSDICNIDISKRHLYLAPLIMECSIHNNCGGQFNSFYKKDGVGHWGGKNENALNRIKSPIQLNTPIFTPWECNVNILKDDINQVVKTLPQMDITYYDPPYNKHPYGTYYFMLNVINDWNLNMEVPNNVRGQKNDWKRSRFNSLNSADSAMEELIRDTRSNYIIMSYNKDGIINEKRLNDILTKYGSVNKKNLTHGTYNRLIGQASFKRESKNTKEALKSKENTETLWILKKK